MANNLLPRAVRYFLASVVNSSTSQSDADAEARSIMPVIACTLHPESASVWNDLPVVKELSHRS